jgi:gas vesicle protein
LIALAGGIVGALIGSMGNYLIAWKKQKDDLALEKRKSAAQIKGAARLIYIELMRELAIVDSSVTKGQWNISKISTESWDKFSHVLAPVMSDSDWMDACTVHSSLEHVLGKRQMVIDGKETNTIYPGNDLLPQTAKKLVEGIRALQKWQADNPAIYEDPEIPIDSV